jgi:hypothetical protein
MTSLMGMVLGHSIQENHFEKKEDKKELDK